MSIFLRVLTITGLLILSSLANAQKWYQVEVIIFSQQDKFGDEVNKLKLDLAYPANLIRLHTTPNTGQTASGSNFILPGKGARRLSPDAYTLNSTGVYKVLYHQVWQQPGFAPGIAPWIAVHGGQKIADHYQLEGSIRLYLSDYLHLDTNLWLIEAEQNTGPDGDASPDEATNTLRSYRTTDQLPMLPKLESTQENLTTPLAIPVTIEPVMISQIEILSESIRLQLDKLHYIDHPKMGLLINVSRHKVVARTDEVSITKVFHPAPVQRVLAPLE